MELSDSKRGKLLLLRHGESEWNKKNLFTGWIDIPLSAHGIEEAFAAGHQFAHIPFESIFVSKLVRAQMTALLAMSVHTSVREGGKVPCVQHVGEEKFEQWSQVHSKETEASCIPVYVAWQLNERMYGDLQGLNKDETRKKFGDEQVHIWRRSFAVAPPHGESLKMTAERAIPYFKNQILPRLEKGENVFVCAHGNSLRAIIMHLENLSEDQILQRELSCGDPLLYAWSNLGWNQVGLA